MDDPPYTTPEEDPFNIHPLIQYQPRRRRSSMLDKWIYEQQVCHTDRPTPEVSNHIPSASSQSHPYLAYPELHRSSLDRTNTENDGASEYGYDLVNDDDIPQSLADDFSNMKIPDSPATIRSKRASRISLTPSSFRHFNIAFRAPFQAEETSSRRSSRASIFSRPNRYSSGTITGGSAAHSTPQKSFRRSMQIANPSHESTSPCTPSPATASSSKWRPSVLGHFGPFTASQSQASIQCTPTSDTNYTPSRPSVSSSIDTYAQTSLTIPSTEGSSGHHSPALSSSSEARQVPFSDSLRSQSTYRGSAPFLNQLDFGKSTLMGASSTSLWSQIHPSSLNSTNMNSSHHFDSNKHLSSSSPPSTTSNTRNGVVRTVPRMYPFVYNNHTQVPTQRGANTFNGYYNNHNNRTPDAVASTPRHDDEGDPDEDGQMHRQRSTAVLENMSPQQRRKPHVVYSSGGGSTLSRMSSLSNLALAPMMSRSRKKKKKLVVSGIAPNDIRRFEGVKRWCESFGEIRQITRMPNGDLVVSFQSAEVADTVCRVRAKVFINGVGSVHLSWIAGNKR